MHVIHHNRIIQHIKGCMYKHNFTKYSGDMDVLVHFGICRKLSEVETVGPPEATEASVNKINAEHVSIPHVLCTYITSC